MGLVSHNEGSVAMGPVPRASLCQRATCFFI